MSALGAGLGPQHKLGCSPKWLIVQSKPGFRGGEVSDGRQGQRFGGGDGDGQGDLPPVLLQDLLSPPGGGLAPEPEYPPKFRAAGREAPPASSLSSQGSPEGYSAPGTAPAVLSAFLIAPDAKEGNALFLFLFKLK